MRIAICEWSRKACLLYCCNACLNGSSIIRYGSVIRCDVSQSGVSTTNGINMIGINGRKYIIGCKADYTSVLTDSDTTIATNNKDSCDIFCSGNQSSHKSRLSTANNLYCIGN